MDKITLNNEFRKIKGILNFELEIFARFPLIEIYFLFIFVMEFFLFFNSTITTSITISDENLIKEFNLREIFVIKQYFGIINFFNSLILSLFISNSFNGEQTNSFNILLLKFPISKNNLFFSKVSFYFVIGFIANLITLLIVLNILNMRLKFEEFVIINLIIINIVVFSIIVALAINMISENNVILSNLLLIIFWIILFVFQNEIIQNNGLSKLIRTIFVPNYILSEYYEKGGFVELYYFLIAFASYLVFLYLIYFKFKYKEYS